jgi:membrane protein DedA with SNARE-associated domain
VAAPLPGPLADLAPILDQYGYAAVGVLVCLDSLGIPVPGETILIAAGVYAGTGRLDIVAVALVGLAAAVVGDNIGYLIGRVGGRRAVIRWGRFVLLTPKRFQRAERFFDRHGTKIVAVARFIEGLRQANGIVAGTIGMPWRRFLPANVVGAVLWVGVWSTIAYVTGRRIFVVYELISRYAVYAWIAAGVVGVALIARHLLRRRRGG